MKNQKVQYLNNIKIQSIKNTTICLIVVIFLIYKSKSVSRVLSRMAIYLLHILLHVSSHQIKKMTSSLILLVSVLLQMGFTQPSMSPYQRWALTSPFHPYLTAVIFCCTFLKVALTGRYPASLLCGARTFLVRCLSALLYATI